MSLSHAHAAMSDARRTALRRNYETTKLERDAMALAYSKSGASTAGNINLQQYDWKLDRLIAELREAGEIVAVDPVRVEPQAEPKHTLSLKGKR